MRGPRKGWVFWPLLFVVLLADCTSKRAAVDHLSPPGTPHEVLGNTVRLTLAFNDGAAMGLVAGATARVGLGVVSLLVVGALLLWYRRLDGSVRLLPASMALLIAGALGNGVERLASARGVVDFIDVGLGATRFWVFNVADVAITMGAVLLFFHASRLPRDPRETVGT